MPDADGLDGAELSFTGELWYWRGPAPFHFVTVPAGPGARLRDVCAEVSYGWGMVPVRAAIGSTEWETSLFPKNGSYVLPVKDAIRRAAGVDDGDIVAVRLTVTPRWGRPLR